MAHQENPAFHLTLWLTGSDHVVRRVAGEQRVDKLLIHHKFQHQGNCTDDHKNQRGQRMVEPIEERGDDAQRNRKRDEAHKRLAVHGEFLNLHIVRPLPELFGHHLLRLQLFRAAGRAGADFFNDLFDLVTAILHSCLQVKGFAVCRLLCILQFSHSFYLFEAILPFAQNFSSTKMTLPLCGRRRFTPTGIFSMLQTICLKLFYHNLCAVTTAFQKECAFIIFIKSFFSAYGARGGDEQDAGIYLRNGFKQGLPQARSG